MTPIPYKTFTLRRTITTGPFAIFFTNVNQAMGIPGHSHYAEVTVTFTTDAMHGWPVFQDTCDVLHQRLTAECQKVFRDCTNEDVADRLFFALNDLLHGENEIIDKWGGAYSLDKIELAIRGVPDKINHCDGWARYAVERVPIVQTADGETLYERALPVGVPA